MFTNVCSALKKGRIFNLNSFSKFNKLYILSSNTFNRYYSSAASEDAYDPVQLPDHGGGYLQTGHRDAAAKTNQRILVTGAIGQLGSAIIKELSEIYGKENVIASDVKRPTFRLPNPFIYLDVLNTDQLARVVLEYQIDTIIHFAAMLSALGERSPQLALKLNARGIENVLEAARINNLKIFAPSSIAVYGPTTPRDFTPDETIMRPTTIYGVTKVYLELLGEYYHKRFGVDFRSLRYPGIISSDVLPGGGTTDYAVEIYRVALLENHYKCFLRPDTILPMMHMNDCVKATLMFMHADDSKLSRRVYNVGGISFSPEEQVESIQKIIPDFQCEYIPDFRQSIADTWPKTIDDSKAREDWNWKPDIDIDKLSSIMVNAVRNNLIKNGDLMESN